MPRNRLFQLALSGFLIVAGSPALANVDDTAICKAAIGTIMGRPVSIMQVFGKSGGVVNFGYVRPDDGKRWGYRCRVEGDKVIWATDTGRWHTPADEVITWRTVPNAIRITVTYPDGSNTVKDFPLSGF